MQCPICQSSLKIEKFGETTEERCIFNIEDHFFCTRSKDSFISKQKIRLKDNENNLVVVIDYDQQTCEVWRNDDDKKIFVPIAFQADFSNLDKIKQKIKTYLLFG